MRLFIGYECSGAMRRKFSELGWEVISCDLKPAEDGANAWSPSDQGRHYAHDVHATLEWLMRQGWVPDFAIFHPPCTYLTNSAEWAYADPDFTRYPSVGYHQKVKPGTLTGALRRAARRAEVANFRRLAAYPFVKAIENPRGTIGTTVRKASQIVQPYQFGDDASKGTCWWYYDAEGNDVPALVVPTDPAKRLHGRMVFDAKLGKTVERWANQTDSGQNNLGPREDRDTNRARTYPHLTNAMAEHWHRVLTRAQTPVTIS